jgi:two-component system sensor histidine kinase AlgZ
MQQTAKLAFDLDMPLVSARTFVWWKDALVVLLIWSVLIVLSAFASLHDVELSGAKTSIGSQLIKTLMVLLPRALLSVGLAFYFQRHYQSLLTLRRLSCLAFMVLVLFIPPYLGYKVTFLIYRSKHHFPSIAEIFSHLTLLTLWLELMLTLFALSAQIAYSYWYKTRQQLLASGQARQHVLDLKLIQLQGQLEPYFLLNSLNEIENLVVEAEGPLATRALARLSELLRYIMETTQDEWPSVADELSFVRDYLSLQNLRFSDRLTVRWELEEQVWEDFLCPPLLLYPLVEYAIKNIEAQLLTEAANVCISCSILENHLHVVLKYRGLARRVSSSVAELSAAKQRMFLLFGHTAFIQSMHIDPTHSGNANFTDGVMLAFPVRLRSDD